MFNYSCYGYVIINISIKKICDITYDFLKKEKITLALITSINPQKEISLKDQYLKI